MVQSCLLTSPRGLPGHAYIFLALCHWKTHTGAPPVAAERSPVLKMASRFAVHVNLTRASFEKFAKNKGEALKSAPVGNHDVSITLTDALQYIGIIAFAGFESSHWPPQSAHKQLVSQSNHLPIHLLASPVGLSQGGRTGTNKGLSNRLTSCFSGTTRSWAITDPRGRGGELGGLQRSAVTWRKVCQGHPV